MPSTATRPADDLRKKILKKLSSTAIEDINVKRLAEELQCNRATIAYHASLGLPTRWRLYRAHHRKVRGRPKK